MPTATSTTLPEHSPEPTLDLAEIDQIVAEVGHGSEDCIPILQAIQHRWHYLPEAALRRVCATTDVTPAAITGVATFYSQFRLRPMGQHMLHVCTGTACHVKGAERIIDAVRRHLGLADGQDTDAANRFTLQPIACLGCCTLAPVVQIDSVTYGHMTPEDVPGMLDDFLERAAAGDETPTAHGPEPDAPTTGEIHLGLGSCCVAGGSAKVRDALNRALAETGIRATVKSVGCMGICSQTPLLEFLVPGQPPTFYARVQAEDVKDLLLQHFRPQGALRRLRTFAARSLEYLLTGQNTPAASRALTIEDPPMAAFLGPQKRISTEHFGELDPTDLAEYRRHDGFAALRRCLEKRSRDEIIGEIKRSGLRGRGGAGFPTGHKWAAVELAPGPEKYVICNGDEGDPGAFMNRMLFESYPYRVIEGMLIAAYAVGASDGIFYVRAEYPLALRRLREALEHCAAAGLTGPNILGSGFSVNVRIMEGAGAFVCGEETALIASLEGGRGMPRLRPPYPAQYGYRGHPTLVNNCETYALVPWILRHGAEAFAALGTEKSKGTKVFALAGKIARGGLIEVPMGVTLRQIVEEIGGGIAGGRQFKAVQVGGPSGGCIPASLADTPVDYEALKATGAMMGSGGLVVLDDSDCMVEMARYFLRFTQDQSCGKCTFCRIGTRRMLEILDRLCEGKAGKPDLGELEALSKAVKAGSLCGLGKTAPNPVLSTLHYFRPEYEAHVAGKCPAKKCRALIAYSITDKCIGCTRCAQRCPADAIAPEPYHRHTIDQDKCIRCGTCRSVCPADAVEVVDAHAAGRNIERPTLNVERPSTGDTNRTLPQL